MLRRPVFGRQNSAARREVKPLALLIRKLQP
jgi:hypothetical protein